MSILDFFGRVKHENEIEAYVAEGNTNIATDLDVLGKQVKDFLSSERREWMIRGEKYYEGDQDILYYERTIIGEGGNCTTVDNLPNNKIVDNYYSRLVDQKVNYQLGKPFVIETENEAYELALKSVFNKRFNRTLRNIGYDILNSGIAWLYPYIDNNEIKFRRFPSYEILPFWSDIEKTELQAAARIYKEVSFEGNKEVTVEKVDYLTKDGVTHYVFRDNVLIEDVERVPTAYISMVGLDGEVQYYNWGRVPLIPFKFNTKELPLIKRVKSLQDGVNTLTSMFINNMQEDARNTILVIKNYGGQNLGEFRQNLAKYGAVKVEGDGGVDTLNVEVNSANYEAILRILKNAIIANGRGYDSKDDRLNNSPNQLNIQSLYSDIELDANGLEVELQAAFEDVLYFVDTYLTNTGQGNFEGEEVEITFNRDMLINEKDIIDNLVASNFISNETKIALHPYINDVERELERIANERNALNAEFNTFSNAFDNGGVN